MCERTTSGKGRQQSLYVEEESGGCRGADCFAHLQGLHEELKKYSTALVMNIHKVSDARFA